MKLDYYELLKIIINSKLENKEIDIQNLNETDKRSLNLFLEYKRP